MQQLSLKLPKGRGGRRRGAGRKRISKRPSVPHRRRAEHSGAHPVLVTHRALVRPLRSQYVFPTLRLAVEAANRRAPDDFRIVHYSVQADHVHLIVEARDTRTLSSGLRGFGIRVARNVNRLLFRKGKFWDERWHGRALTTPRSVRHALAYVLGNFRKHQPWDRAPVDPFSSAPHFEHFAELSGAPIHAAPHLVPRVLALDADNPPTARPGTWLLRTGWLRHGPLSLFEKPRSAR
nr:MAG: hypothetical protein DIU78_26860 [Pseudomonadota bacterium]